MRTQREIYDRFRKIASEDLFGFRREVLLTVIADEAIRLLIAAGFLKANDFDSIPEQTDEQVTQAAHQYLNFAISKILDHRGLSAGRSIEKLSEYAWLLDRTDVQRAMDDAPYPQYGAPKVRAFAQTMKLFWPSDYMLDRMANGLPCEEGCDMGCGR